MYQQAFKACSLCKVLKSLTEFNKRASSVDGRRSECRECQSSEGKKSYHEGGGKEQKSTEYILHRDKKLKYFKEYGKKRRHNRRYDPEKSPARIAVYRAIKRGQLVRPSECENCSKPCKPEAHHHKGYGKEYRLDVQWLCTQCHSLTENPEFKERLGIFCINA